MKKPRLLQDQYPTHYLPHVGRQVMQDGGTPEGMFPRTQEEQNVAANDLVNYAKQLDTREKMADVGEVLGQTWPVRMAKGIMSGVTAPGDAYQGRLDPKSDEAIQRATELAGTVMGGGFGMAPAGALGSTGAKLAASEAERLARARELGFTSDVYHATRATEPFDEFRMYRGPQRHDLLGVHVGSLQAAEDRLRKYFGKDYGLGSGLANENQAGSIMPLLARMEKPFVKSNGEPFSEAELRRKVTVFADKNKLKPDSINAKVAYEKYLKSQGYDHIPYINSVEDRGNVSYLILLPENLRSRWAEFDPEYARQIGLGKNKGGSVVDRALMLSFRKGLPLPKPPSRQHGGRPRT